MKSNPLVSVVLITYNSSRTVIESLESVKNQDYDTIELIITDDCSTDNTVELCKNWLKENGKYFTNAKILEAYKNTGVSANVNRGFESSNGVWIKGLSGDDKLLPDCISLNMNYLKMVPDAFVLFSNIILWGDKISLESHKIRINNAYFLLPSNIFYKRLLFRNFIPATSSFINRDVYEKYGGFDESIPFLDDWPFWMKLQKHHVKFAYMNQSTVLYRIHNSLSVSSTPNPRFIESQELARRQSEQNAKEISKMLYRYLRVSNKHCKTVFEKSLKKVMLWTNFYHYYFMIVDIYVRFKGKEFLPRKEVKYL